MTAHILYSYYLNADGMEMTIGGVQTYITNLAELLMEMGYEVVVYQQASKTFDTMYGKVKVIGIEGYSERGPVIGQRLLDVCLKSAKVETDVIIFGTDTLTVPCPGYKTITIQHGIYWDIPEGAKLSGFSYLKAYVKKAIKGWREVKRVSCAEHVVCVDYNFVNWYRALVAYPKAKLHAILNFTDIPDEDRIVKPEATVNIIFARRLFPYRGTRLFLAAIDRILSERNKVHVTIAGSGPDEQYLQEKLKKYDNVEFIKYTSAESLIIHADKHIAVVPTTGSEGTSLSLLEAMAAGCAVICTNVGGMTNIVLDHYNGLIIEPAEDRLYQSLKYLIEHTDERKQMAIRGRESVALSFSKSKWRNDWQNLIREITREQKQG